MDRDCREPWGFGARAYHRLDRPGDFHTRWGQDG
jgi:6-phosphogluconate dehydrogenase